MNHSKFSRFALVADLLICSVWLMLGLHSGSSSYYSLLWVIPVLRMWLSFLMYRRSRLALTHRLLIAIFSLAALQM